MSYLLAVYNRLSIHELCIQGHPGASFQEMLREREVTRGTHQLMYFFAFCKTGCTALISNFTSEQFYFKHSNNWMYKLNVFYHTHTFSCPFEWFSRVIWLFGERFARHPRLTLNSWDNKYVPPHQIYTSCGVLRGKFTQHVLNSLKKKRKKKTEIKPKWIHGSKNHSGLSVFISNLIGVRWFHCCFDLHL